MDTVKVKQSEVKRRDRLAAFDELNDRIKRLSDAGQLPGWDHFVREMRIPNDLALAVFTGRHQLVKAAAPRALDAEQCKVLLEIIGTLLETNAALREHASELAVLVDNWASAFTALHRTGEMIQRFANYETLTPDEEP